MPLGPCECLCMYISKQWKKERVCGREDSAWRCQEIKGMQIKQKHHLCVPLYSHVTGWKVMVIHVSARFTTSGKKGSHTKASSVYKAQTAAHRSHSHALCKWSTNIIKNSNTNIIKKKQRDSKIMLPKIRYMPGAIWMQLPPGMLPWRLH